MTAQIIQLSVYEAIAPDRANELQAIAVQIRDRANELQRTQLELADLVARAKELLPNRQNWLRWLSEEFPEMSQRQAYRLVKLHSEGLTALPGAAEQPLGVLEIAATAEPVARAEIEQRLMEGDRLTIAEAQAIAANPDPDSDADWRQQQRVARERLQPDIGNIIRYDADGETRLGRYEGEIDDDHIVIDQETLRAELLGPDDWEKVEPVQAGGEAIAPSNRMHQLAVSHKTSQHNTPQSLLAAVYACLGEIELDPMSDVLGEAANVRAARHYTREMNGLIMPWDAEALWLNPPFSPDRDENRERLPNAVGIAEALAYFLEHWDAERIGEAIVLTKMDSRPRWWQEMRSRAAATCEWAGYLHYGESEDPAAFGTVLWYFGAEVDKFYRCFSPYGWVTQVLVPGVHFGE